MQNRSYSHHQTQCILIGPPIEYWFKTEAWSLKNNGERKASVEDIARSTGSIRSNTSGEPSNSFILPNLTSILSPTLENGNRNSLIQSYSEEIPNPGPSQPYNFNANLSLPSTELPKHSRALVRIEYAKEWYGLAGTYHSNLLNSIERKFLPLKEYGLVLYHNRLELTSSKDSVSSIIEFDDLTKLSLYDTTDYSIAITKEHTKEHITSAHILIFPTADTAKSWYLSLHQIMNNVKQFQENILVSIPELNTKINVLIASPDMKVWSIREAVKQVLKQDDENKQLLEVWEKEGSLGVCWKHLDRIEWVSEDQQYNLTHMEHDIILTPQFIEQTHELQIRTKLHTVLNEVEPFPVEGYLLFRGLFEQSENELKKVDSGKLTRGYSYYITCFQQHIGFISSNKFSKKLKSNLQPLDSIPYALIYPRDRPKFDNNEKYCVDNNDLDMHNNLMLLRNMEGFIDLREVINIESSSRSQENNDPLFDIILFGGSRLRFEAWNLESRKEWISRLKSLLSYWQKRLQIELERQVEFVKFNNDKLNENINLQDHEKMIADPTLWKACLSEHCNHVLKSGVIYIKDRLHSPFRKVHCILALDGLHFFDHSVTSFYAPEQSNTPLDLSRLPSPIKFLHLREKSTCFIPLKSCFVHTGLSLDLVVDGYEAEPQLYPDRLLCNDTELDRTFTLWESHLSYLWPNESNAMGQCGAGFSFIYRSMNCGHSLIWPWHWFQPNVYGQQNKFTFQARSRLERDHWVYCINVALEYWVLNRKW